MPKATLSTWPTSTAGVLRSDTIRSRNRSSSGWSTLDVATTTVSATPIRNKHDAGDERPAAQHRERLVLVLPHCHRCHGPAGAVARQFGLDRYDAPLRWSLSVTACEHVFGSSQRKQSGGLA